MEFTDLYKQSNSQLVSFSPDGKLIAVAVEHRLIVRDAETPKRIHRVYSCSYESAPYIQEILWSPDSQFLLTASYAADRVDVWSLEDESWRCSIHDEVSRVEKALWTPDSRHVLTFSELDLRLSIWSLHGRDERRYIQYPKSSVPVAFHPEGAYMALAQRHDYHDYIAIYATDGWQLVKEIEIATVDLTGLKWSPDGLHIVAWDTASSFCVIVVNVAGIIKRQYQPEDEGLGIRTCAWSPTGQLLALGGYDRKIRVLNHLTWRPIATLVHRPQISGEVDVFSEAEVGQSLAQASQAVLASKQRVHTRFDLESTPTSIKTVVPQDIHRAAEAKIGVSVVEFNAEGTLLASINESMPNALWVWRVADMRLITVIQTIRPIRTCKWSPVESVLAFVTGMATVYVWKQDQGCHLFEIPTATVNVTSLVWNPNGDSLAIIAKNVFTLAFITE
ncbi:WD repeat-containing protein wrap73 [Coemansia erecta]|uniref:WD repeat-containing protein wrap73 n=1 Tax=Coemansia asiatica TaxID=1052880 RepID=A0A9W7XPH4_9FUNG|nr:WD repeat-containing protein wrap73 [Coemansia asiatica]KAJ2858257.1 WD repeat-containing protein wrap73 [Coemansia erecta]KAJ2889164.1 WD repeat-containing protein wrap73 [Coemansia asiatica]